MNTRKEWDFIGEHVSECEPVFRAWRARVPPILLSSDSVPWPTTWHHSDGSAVNKASHRTSYAGAECAGLDARDANPVQIWLEKI